MLASELLHWWQLQHERFPFCCVSTWNIYRTSFLRNDYSTALITVDTNVHNKPKTKLSQMGLLNQTFTKQFCLEGIVFKFHLDKDEPLEFCHQNQWWTPQLFPLVKNSYKIYNKNIFFSTFSPVSIYNLIHCTEPKLDRKTFMDWNELSMQLIWVYDIWVKSHSSNLSLFGSDLVSIILNLQCKPPPARKRQNTPQ